MGLILDTNAVIRLFESHDPAVAAVVFGDSPDATFSIALATRAELARGVASAVDLEVVSQRSMTLADACGSHVTTLYPDDHTARRWGSVAAIAPRRVGHNDLWIMATALQHRLSLVTGDAAVIDLAATVKVNCFVV